MKDVYFAGAAMTPFGRHAGVLAPELAQRAILRAMDDAGVQARDIQAIYCANVLGGMILGQVIVRDLSFGGIPVYNVENACSSGATGVHPSTKSAGGRAEAAGTRGNPQGFESAD